MDCSDTCSSFLLFSFFFGAHNQPRLGVIDTTVASDWIRPADAILHSAHSPAICGFITGLILLYM